MISNPLGISVVPENYELLPKYAAAGINVVEISNKNKTADELREYIRSAYSLLRKSDMTLWGIHLPFGRNRDISCPDEAERTRVIDDLRQIIDIAREYAPKVLVVHGSSEPNEETSRPSRLKACAKSLAELQAYAGDMKLAIENLPRTCIGRTGREVLELSNSCAGICFDVNHLLLEDHAAFLDVAESRIISTHLSDYDGIDEKHWLPGMGIVPWRLVRDRLLAAGYEGPFLFELGLKENGDPYDPKQVVSAWKKLVEE